MLMKSRISKAVAMLSFTRIVASYTSLQYVDSCIIRIDQITLLWNLDIQLESPPKLAPCWARAMIVNPTHSPQCAPISIA